MGIGTNGVLGTHAKRVGISAVTLPLTIVSVVQLKRSSHEGEAMKRKKSVRHEKIKSFRAWALVMPWDKVVDSHFQEGADANIYEIFDRKTCDEDANKNLIRVEIRQVNIIRKKRP